MEELKIKYAEYSSQFIDWLNQTMTIKLFIKITILYFLILWVFIILWTMKDSSERSNSFLFQLFSLLLVTIGTPLGILIYLLIRPPKTIYERYTEEVEFNLKELTKTIKEKESQIEKQKKQLEKLKKEEKKIKETKTTKKKKTNTKKVTK